MHGSVLGSAEALGHVGATELPAPFGPLPTMDSLGEATVFPASPCWAPNAVEAQGVSEATDLPASSCSPLFFPVDEATAVPASLTTPPATPIPEFTQLVSPPLQSKAPTKLLQVYSRRRPRQRPRGLSPPICMNPEVGETAERNLQMVGDVAAAGPAPSLTSNLGAESDDIEPPELLNLARGVAVPPATPPLAEDFTPLGAQAAFLNKITRGTAALLPVPAVHKSRCKAPQYGNTLRHSRRLAGAAAEFLPKELARKTKKTMCTLKIIGETEDITQQALDNYAKLFAHPLPDQEV
ncbi:hypothetical protein ACP4OV_014259 [Aristida adscensionis]